MDDEFLISRLGRQGQKEKQDSAAKAKKNMEENLRLLKEVCIK
tara:strand:- start:621 stop:749 length:129 start_codon:yes stop_codon:yes gene_type:complete